MIKEQYSDQKLKEVMDSSIKPLMLCFLQTTDNSNTPDKLLSFVELSPKTACLVHDGNQWGLGLSDILVKAAFTKSIKPQVITINNCINQMLDVLGVPGSYPPAFSKLRDAVSDLYDKVTEFETSGIKIVFDKTQV